MSVSYGRSQGFQPSGTGIWGSDYTLTSIDNINYIASYEHWQFGDRGYTIVYENNQNVLYVNTGNNTATPSTVNGAASAVITNGTVVNMGNISYTIAQDDLWSSSGGGTSTEGVPTPQGSVGRIGQSIVVTIDKNSPSTSASVSYSIQKDGVSQGPGISHTNNTTTDFVQNLPFATGIWQLWYQESGGGDQRLDIFNATEGRKRHANFW